MPSETSQSKRRAGVVLNYVLIVCVAVLFYIGKYHGWSIPLYVGIGTAVAVILIGFARLHIRSDLWRLVHAEVEKLDEREVQLTSESLKYAYGIFSVVSLFILLILALTAGRRDSMLIVIFVSLLYLAHTLPSAVMTWRQKRL